MNVPVTRIVLAVNMLCFIQISKCLGKSFQHNGHGVDAKDLAEKMQRLSTEVSTQNVYFQIFFSHLHTKVCSTSFYCKILLFPEG